MRKLIILAALMSACAGPKPLGRDVAEAALAKVPGMSSERSDTLELTSKTCDSKEFGASESPLRASLHRFERAGWVTVRELGPDAWADDQAFFQDMQRCPPGMGQWVRVELSPAGKQAAKTWTQTGSSYVVPVATRKFGGITGITQSTPQQATVEYTWSWLPTANGEALGYSSSPSVAQAKFQLYDDGWRIATDGLD